MHPGRTALRDLDEVEDAEGGLGLVIRFPHLRRNWTSRVGPSTRLRTSADRVGSTSSTDWRAVSRWAIHSTDGALNTACADAS